jgi:hypothetical protein
MMADNNRLGNLIAPLAIELLGVSSVASSAASFSDTPTVVSNSSSSNVGNSSSLANHNANTLRRSQELCGGETTTSLASASTLAQIQLSLSIDEVNALILSEKLSSDISTLTQSEILEFLATAISRRLERSVNGLSSSTNSNAVNLISGMRACGAAVSFTVQNVAVAAGLIPGFPSPSPVPSPKVVVSNSSAPPYYIIGIIFGLILVMICVYCLVARKRNRRSLKDDALDKAMSQVVLRSVVTTA